jgi:uncharacterized protein (DUF1501 family)
MISRRSFLKDSLAIVSLGIAVPGVFSKAIVASAEEKATPSLNGRTLVVVQLAGGVDGLNTIIPYTDPAYRSFRRTLAIGEDEMLVLNDRAAFHPSMAGLKRLFDAGQMAVVEGTGYPEPNFSHFKAMDIWQSADPRGVSGEGWLGRYFEGVLDAEGHPLAGLSVGRSLAGAFESSAVSVPSIESLETFGLQGASGDANAEARTASLMKLYDLYRPANTPFAALLDTTLDNATRSATDLAAAHAAYTPAVTYPESSLASGLQLLAELIDSGGADGSPLRVGHVSIGGFDTHAQQPQRLATLLTETSEALAAFWEDVTAHGHGDDVLVMTWSEFGRRVPENAQAGTDHGSAGPMFFISNALNGGFYGEPPSLTNLDNDNLRFTTDFRSVYATVLEKWLEAPSAEILGDRFDTLDFLKV